jgi:hypothetical protein
MSDFALILAREIQRLHTEVLEAMQANDQRATGRTAAAIRDESGAEPSMLASLAQRTSRRCVMAGALASARPFRPSSSGCKPNASSSTLTRWRPTSPSGVRASFAAKTRASASPLTRLLPPSQPPYLAFGRASSKPPALACAPTS